MNLVNRTDIARKLGLNVSTVSRVLNNRRSVFAVFTEAKRCLQLRWGQPNRVRSETKQPCGVGLQVRAEVAFRSFFIARRIYCPSNLLPVEPIRSTGWRARQPL